MEACHDPLGPALAACAAGQPGQPAYEAAVAEVLAAAAPVVRAALWDHMTEWRLICDEHDRAEVLAETNLAVLRMVSRYDPLRCPTFATWVSALSAPWRLTLADQVRKVRYGPAAGTPARRRAFSILHAAEQDYIDDHGRPPNDDELAQLVADWAEHRYPGQSQQRVQERNRRSGFTGAVEHFREYRQVADPLRLDEPLSAGDPATLGAVSASPEPGPEADAVDGAEASAWRRLAGDDPAVAASRMLCPHAQWIHLAPAALLPDGVDGQAERPA